MSGHLARVDWQIPNSAVAEFAAAFLQGAVTVALALLCAYLWHVYRKRYFLVWALAWALYSLRIAVIVAFIVTERRSWLFWHQVVTGWTALALLYGALVFARGIRWRPAWAALGAFPVLWSYIAIYRLDNFLLAAGPAVLFLSLATALTAWTFDRHRRRAGSTASGFLAVMFLLWALHHLDYPFLRARGVWTPWGYYLDTLMLLGVGLGTLLLVQEDLRRGLVTLSEFSSVLQARSADDLVDRLLAGLLTLPAVRGSALVVPEAGATRIYRAAGACAEWERLDDSAARAALRALEQRRPAVSDDRTRQFRYTAALPILDGDDVRGAIIVVSDARDPFAALDESFLVTVGQQIGAALAHADLTRRLAARSADLERLAGRMVRQHEEERRRISRELHDETAQVLAAVNMQIGLAREAAGPPALPPLDRALGLIGDGIRGIRRVTDDLRPSLLDDLGLTPALRGLVDDFRDTHALDVGYDAPDRLPHLSEEAELALFRALQEALSNVARHAAASHVVVTVATENGHVRLRIRDDGRGFDPDRTGGGTGIVGMRERIQGLGGDVHVRGAPGNGAELLVRIPVKEEDA